MSAKSSTSTKKKIPVKATSKKISWKMIKTQDDKMLEKIEKYVDMKREKTSQEILERKSKRPVKKFQEADIEVMISRISVESSKPKENTKKISKWVVYMIYVIVLFFVIIFCIKYFFSWNMPQIS